MYTIKNISSKIINIDTGIPNKRFTIVMPDQSIKVTEAAAGTPAIKALAKRKMLEIIAPVVEAPADDQNDQTGDVEPDAQNPAGGDGEPEKNQESAEAPKAKPARRTAAKAKENAQ